MVDSLDEAYRLIRQHGERGEYTRKAELSMPKLSGYLVVDILTYAYGDIAEEDDGGIFSVFDWSIIATAIESKKLFC